MEEGRVAKGLEGGGEVVREVTDAAKGRVTDAGVGVRDVGEDGGEDARGVVVVPLLPSPSPSVSRTCLSPPLVVCFVLCRRVGLLVPSGLSFGGERWRRANPAARGTLEFGPRRAP